MQRFFAEHLGASGENLVIGLNPPYGMNNALAAKFQDHAVRFRPHIIVLIVPPTTPVSFPKPLANQSSFLEHACRIICPSFWSMLVESSALVGVQDSAFCKRNTNQILDLAWRLS